MHQTAEQSEKIVIIFFTYHSVCDKKYNVFAI